MNVFMNIRVAEITYEVLETDVLEVAVTLIKYCAVSDLRDLKCVTQVGGLARDEVIEEQLRVEEWIGDDCVRTSIAKEVELDGSSPDVEDLLTIMGEVAKAEYRTMNHAVYCDGVLEVSIVYRSPGGEGDLHQIDERIEFTHNMDLFGTEPGMNVYANHKLTDLTVQKISDNKIRVVGQLEVYAKVTKPRRLTVVTDILNDMVDSEKVAVVLEEVVGRNRVKDSIIHRINVPPTRPDIERILQSYARVKDLTSIVNDGGVVVEGSLEGTSFYTAGDEFVDGEMTVCLKDYFDFDTFVPIEDCEEGMDVYVEAEVKRASCQVLNDRTLEMNVVLERSVKVTNRVELECVTDLVEISPMVGSESRPSFVVYVVQRGDTLPKIARRYKVNLDALIDYNNLEDPDQMEIGQKLAIPKSMIGALG
jgi:LysM repeat protein